MKFTFEPHKTIDEIGSARVLPVRFDAERKEGILIERNGFSVYAVGVKRAEDMTRRKLPRIIRGAIRGVRTYRMPIIAIDLRELLFPHLQLSLSEVAELAAIEIMLANYEYVRFRTEPEEGWGFIKEVILVGELDAHVKRAIRNGRIIGEEINASRTLANTPGGMMTPRLLALAAQKAAKKVPDVSVKVFNKKEIEKKKMGAILGVARGSSEDPRFIIMEYRGASKREEKPVVLVGKGVTFDSGGLNLKPTGNILGMNLDMSGGAAVMHTVLAAARLKIKRNIVALIPAVENMPSGESYRPGDVLKSLSGKTIEILNTDAEGRVILADALTYAKRYRPKAVIDVATLTGAAMVALGTECSALMSRDDALADALVRAGEEAVEPVWRLPLWDEYEQYVKGTFGDVANANAKGQPYGGAINGGMFLWQFAKDLSCPWAHIDIAPRMEATEADRLAKGSVGAPIKLLIQYLRNPSRKQSLS